MALPGVCFAVDAVTKLDQNLGTFGTVLDHLQSDQQMDIDETLLDAGAEVFPATPEEESLEKLPEDSPFVTFRIAGVPYQLTDVPNLAWFAPYVRDVAEKGIVSGYKSPDGVPLGIFGPERNVSIEELSKMAIEAAHLSTASCGTPKNPAAANSWSSAYIACAEQAGFAVYGDGTVDIKRSATRAEVVMTILQGFGVQLKDMPEASPFTDVSASTLFSSAIYTASQDNVVGGYTKADGTPTGTFGPDKPVNRAEVAKIISLGVQLYAKH